MQKFSLAQIFLVVFVVSLIACDGKKGTMGKIQPSTQPLSATYNAPFSESVAPISKGVYQAPKGENCENVFKKNAAQISEEKAGVYGSEGRYRYINEEKETAMLVNLFYNSGTFGLMLRLAHKHKNICVEHGAPFGMRFTSDKNVAYVLEGRHKSNCTKLDGSKNDYAVGIYELPINSLAFKAMLENDLEFFAVQTSEGFTPMAAINSTEGVTGFKNAVRCAYEAVGNNIDLSDNSSLINNSLIDSNQNDADQVLKDIE